jgi:hypothetical protein
VSLLNSIISFLIACNQFLLKQIRQLLLFFARHIPLKDSKDNSSPHYTKLTVDKLPIIKQPEKLDYKQLLRDYKSQHGKMLPSGGAATNKTERQKIMHDCD